MTSVVTGRPICVVVVLFMLCLGVCLHMTQCLVVDGHSELIMVSTPARHLAYSGGSLGTGPSKNRKGGSGTFFEGLVLRLLWGRGTIDMLGPSLYFSMHTVTYDVSEYHVRQ